MEPLGIIGVGLLGSALAERALAAGIPVVGFDVDSARLRALEAAGGRTADSVGVIAGGCSRLLLALPDERVVCDVLAEARSMLRPNAVVLDATTGSPEAAVERCRELAEVGVTYLDATISGSSEHVRRGEALLMIGGSEGAFAAVEALGRTLAGQAVHTGPCGSGSRMKLVTNLVLGLNRAALAEGLALARALGLDAARALEVLRASVAYSRVMDTKGGRMIRGDFVPEARLSQHLKDVRLMIEAAGRAGQRLPLSETHRELLELAERLGLGTLDNSAVLRAIEARRTDTRR